MEPLDRESKKKQNMEPHDRESRKKQFKDIKLTNIKSTNITKKIISFLEEISKLELIKYNRYYQNLLSLNIESYKKKSGKYKKGGINGQGKEFLIENDKLIFEGEYLNGKRNGKGKEYSKWSFSNSLEFEGEYLNGKRNGKGKEYYYNDKVEFEGEYLNGQRNGKGKEYYINGKLKFRGEYLKGKKWNGIGYDVNNHKVYELKHGSGYIKEYDNYEYDLLFEGEYLNGEKNGKGKEYYYSYGPIESSYKKYCFKESPSYMNERYIAVDFHKIKVFKEFEGEYLNGQRNGKGKEYYNNGKLKFEGEYLKGKKWNGIGYDINNNKVYELKHGSGYIKEYYADGKLKIEGEYLNGERNGKFKEYNIEYEEIEFWQCEQVENHEFYYLEFEGEYKNGQRNGKGKEYNREKELIYEGEYLNGKKIGKRED